MIAMLAGFIAGFFWMGSEISWPAWQGAIVVGFGFLIGTALVTAIIVRLVRGRAYRCRPEAFKPHQVASRL